MVIIVFPWQDIMFAETLTTDSFLVAKKYYCRLSCGIHIVTGRLQCTDAPVLYISVFTTFQQ